MNTSTTETPVVTSSSSSTVLPIYTSSTTGEISLPIACCPYLRCKSMYYRTDERPGKLHESDVMNYWCLKTQDPEGPDGLNCRPST